MASNMKSMTSFNHHWMTLFKDKIRFVSRYCVFFLFYYNVFSYGISFYLFFTLKVGSLLVESTRKYHSGNYSCNPSNSAPAQVTLHVISSKCPYLCEYFKFESVVISEKLKRYFSAFFHQKYFHFSIQANHLHQRSNHRPIKIGYFHSSFILFVWLKFFWWYRTHY